MSHPKLYSTWTWMTWIVIAPLALLALGIVLVTTTEAAQLPFDNPELWWLGGAVPLAGLVYLHGWYHRRAAVNRFAGAHLAGLLAEGVSPYRQALRSGLVVMAVVFIVAGVLGPRWGVYMEKFKARGVDVVVAVDVSRSMLADDIEPSRLERAKREIRQQLIERAALRHANRFGLLAFAGTTSLKVPLTTDYMAFRNQLRQLNIGSAPRGGTAIGEAIIKAADLFETSTQEATRVLLLFTDGEDHEGDPVAAAKEAYETHGIRVFTVGVGDASRTAGARVPSSAEARGKPLLHDGQIVFSKLNVTALRQMAEAGGGRYAPVQDFHALVNAVAALKQTELSIEERRRHIPRYQWFIAVALILLGLETIMKQRGAGERTASRRSWEEQAT